MRGRLDEHNPIHMIQLKPVLVLTLVRQVLPQEPVGWSGLGSGAWKWLSEGWVNSGGTSTGTQRPSTKAFTVMVWLGLTRLLYGRYITPKERALAVDIAR